jgi:amidophosphoribosyltransferase
MDNEQIQGFIGADSLHYISQEGMFKALKNQNVIYCAACFSGNYPAGTESLEV